MLSRKVFIITALIVVLVAGGILTYFITTSQSTATKMNSPHYTACTNTGGDDTFCTFVYAMKDKPEGSYAVTVTTSKGASVTEYDGKGNSRTDDTVILNDTTYIKDDAVWLRMPKSDTEAPAESASYKNSTNDAVKNSATSGIPPESLGTKQYKNKTLTGYGLYLDAERANTTEYWFDAHDQKLYQLIQGMGDTKTEMEFSYRTIVIAEPQPVQPFGI